MRTTTRNLYYAIGPNCQPDAWSSGPAARTSGLVLVVVSNIDDGFAIARTAAPRWAWDKSLADVALRTKFGVTVVGVKKVREDFEYARPETVVERDHELVVAGPTDKVELFSTEAARGRA